METTGTSPVSKPLSQCPSNYMASVEITSAAKGAGGCGAGVGSLSYSICDDTKCIKDLVHNV